MKKIVYILIIAFLYSCGFQKYVSINEIDFIPNGTTVLKANSSIEELKTIFDNANIHTEVNDLGLNTDVFLIDEGTKAKYELFEDDEYVLIHCYWGITDVVANQISIAQTSALGTGYGNYQNTDMKRLTYKSHEGRPKMVMDYMVTLLQNNRVQFSWE